MQTKEERDAVMAPVVMPNDSKAILSDDPTQVVVQGPDGELLDWASRKGFGSQQQKLAVPRRPGFEPYWFNDEPERIAMARAAGWTPRLDENGVPMSRVVDKNTGMKAYLHDIPEAWYKADLAAGQKRPDEVERQLKGGNALGQNGSAPGVDGKAFYGGIKIGRKATG
jgi:hypothetical protein